MRQVPLAPPSKLKPWMWNVQTCGSLACSGLLSPAPSWIFTSPLFPGGSAYAGLTASNRRASAAMSPRTPVDLRIGMGLLDLLAGPGPLNGMASEHAVFQPKGPSATGATRG